MNRTWTMVLAIAIVVVAFSSCSQPETEEPSGGAEPATMEKGPDPTSVDAAHYKVEFENDRVRILRITYGPGEESVMHHHPTLYFPMIEI